MDELNHTPAPHRLQPRSPRRFDAAGFFANKDRLARLSLGVALSACLGAGLALLALVRQQGRATQFIVLDAADNIVVAAAKNFAAVPELQVQQALLASTALLSRNAKDFDQPEILRLMLTPAALAIATSLKASEARQFEENQFQQKPQLRKIEIRQSTAAEARVHVSGELLRFGLLRDRAFTEVIPFTLELVLRRNPDLVLNRQQPTIVSEFQLTYETAH